MLYMVAAKSCHPFLTKPATLMLTNSASLPILPDYIGKEGWEIARERIGMKALRQVIELHHKTGVRTRY